MSDNRARARIHRTDNKHDKALRDYATQFQIEPWRALEIAIGRLKDPDGPAIDRLTRERDEERGIARKVASDLLADLESAREATRRADAEAERLTRELAGERLKTEAAQAREQQARTEAADLQARRSGAAPCACALPDDLAARVKARIKARPGRDFAFVVKNGCDRLEGSDGYQDRQKAARAAKDNDDA